MAFGLTAFSRVEYIDAITFNENSQQTLPTNGGLLPNDRFMNGILLEFRGRLTMPAATGPTAVQADAHAGIIERITVEGYHRVRRQQERIVDLRGSDLELLNRVYYPGTPIKTPASISVTANATNDIVLQLPLSFTPLRIPAQHQASFLLDAPNYESLKLTVFWGDYKSVVVAGTTAPTWSAYGETSGSPTLRVYGQYAIQNARFAGFVPGRVFRYFQEISGSIPTTTQTQARIWDIPRGFDIRYLAVKSGVKATDTSAGNNAFSSLSDYLSDLRVNVGLGKYVRRYLDGNAMYADLAQSYNLSSRVAGLNVFDFAQYGDLSEVLSTRNMISGPTGNTDLYFSADVAGASNQAAVMLLEEVRYRPLRQGVR